ncbi:ABC transporter permease [Varibaculum prostatecancerukia]|uniref:ABC transporter permease n=1 Tax=Varibaculum prostatecancerukia TaxID=2811781 RepID=UPI001BFFFFD5|nr:ABC transporter permease [Varibaculum prostatecancerukia]
MKHSSRLVAAGLVLLTLALWEGVCRLGQVNPKLLPAPSVIIKAGIADWPAASLATQVTLIEVLAGTSLAIISGIAISFALWRAKTFGKAVMPLLVISQTIPVVAIAPLLIIWFGFGMTSKILLVALFGVFPLIVAFTKGLSAPSRDQIDVARSLGASPAWIFAHLRMPAALGDFMTGLRIAVTYGPATAATAEFVGAENGLGIYLLTAQGSFRTELVFFGAGILTLMTLAAYLLVELAERILIPWKKAK